MKAEQPLWSKPVGTPEARPAERSAHDAAETVTAPAKETRAAIGQPTKGDPIPDRKWPWPQTLRFLVLMSGLFWLIVGLCVWAFLSAG